MTEDTKSVVNATFGEVEAGEITAVALPHSNSETVIEAIINETDRDLSAAGNDLEGLKAHSRAGQRLSELKTHLDHGSFNRVVLERLGINRGWRAKLMKVGRLWPDIVTAIEWAKAHGRLTRSGYSVDGALALLADWQRDTASSDGTADKIFSTKGNVSNRTVGKKRLIEQLEQLKQFAMKLLRKLLQAQRYIAFLESEIERLTGAAPQEARREDQLLLPLPAEAPRPDQSLLPFPEHMQ